MKLFKLEEKLIDDIIIVNRARKDTGDIDILVQSIHESGQLNPVLITENNELIAGERRIRALQKLNQQTVIVRVMPDISPTDKLIIERMENVARKDFDWHEELELRYELHKLWKQQAESKGDTWGYRETAKQLKCSLGGLSTDLALAEALETFPELKNNTSKGRAKDAYKQMGIQAVAIQRMNNMSDEEKERLKKLHEGAPIDLNKKSRVMLKAKHADESPNIEDFNNDKESDFDPTIKESNVLYAIESYKTFLPKIPNEIIGMVELDPPYAIAFDSTYGKTGNIKSKATDWTEKELYEFYFDYLPILYKKMMPSSWVLCWTGKEHALRTNEIAQSVGFMIQPPGVWKKNGGSTNQPKTNMISNYEMFLLFRKGDAQFNTSSLHAALEFPTVPAQQRIHQWEKPLELYDHFLKALGRPGTIFLSLFAGSGNAMISAAKNNMTPMGCDENQKYVAQFYQRLQNYVKV